MKPKLLVVELWGLGDLAVAAPFLRAAIKKYSVTLLGKPLARDLAPYLWPEATVITWVAPWTAFTGKYNFFRWDWPSLRKAVAELRSMSFDCAVSSRWDPRDHLLMATLGSRERIGFGRLGSGTFLTQNLAQGDKPRHRFTNWEALAERLGISPLDRPKADPDTDSTKPIVVHTGAAQELRVWSLDRFAKIAARLRDCGHRVQVACDSGQRGWWLARGEADVVAPGSIVQLVDLLRSAALFIGNDSGPGHLAACLGIPTFTIFGNQLPELFAPIHQASEWIEGRPCKHKPCFDSCRFAEAYCLTRIPEAEVWEKISLFVHDNYGYRSPELRGASGRRQNI